MSVSWPPDPPEPDMLEIECQECVADSYPVIWEVPVRYTGLDENGNPEWELYEKKDAVCPVCGSDDWAEA